MSPTSIRYWTAGIAVASAILALGDKAVAFPGVPGWLTSSWPFVLAAAGVFKEVANILTAPTPTTVATPEEANAVCIKQSLPDPQAFRQPLGQPQKPA